VHARSHARLLGVVLGAVLVAGCAADAAPAPAADAAPAPAAGAETSAQPAAPAPAEAVELVDGRVLIDVRTPAEIDAGALEGALAIDIQSPDFVDQVSALPRDEAYFVYCRSGNRSGQAIEIMRDLGFTDLVNGGGFEDLREAGLPTTG
jgi:phage shock protein E